MITQLPEDVILRILELCDLKSVLLLEVVRSPDLRSFSSGSMMPM